jgi:type IV pilus assembly protein PilC
MSQLRNFFLQLETALGSGVPIVRSLHLLSKNISGWGMKAKVERIARIIESGRTLSEAMQTIGSPFTRMQISFIRFGEEAGCLEQVCGSLAKYADREQQVQREVINSLLYPGFVLLFAVVMAPLLATIAKQQPWEGAIPTAMLNAVLFVGGTFGFWAFYQFIAAGAIDSLLVHVPLIGGIMRNFALSRFARGLSVGLFAGVPLQQALHTAIEVSNNPWLQQQLRHMPSHVAAGKPLAAGLESVQCLPGTLTEMIIVGEQSGKLPEMLEKTAAIFEEEATNRISMVMKILPAVVFLAVAVYIGFMIVSSAENILGNRGLSDLFGGN